MTAIHWTIFAACVLGTFLFGDVRIVRPTGRELVERLGKYHRLAIPGFNRVMPLVERMFLVNITEVMVNAEPQEIITSDKLNALPAAMATFTASARPLARPPRS
jgi:regulator of protease activity HflC (stomatin/prohibitin superfamily)